MHIFASLGPFGMKKFEWPQQTWLHQNKCFFIILVQIYVFDNMEQRERMSQELKMCLAVS